MEQLARAMMQVTRLGGELTRLADAVAGAQEQATTVTATGADGTASPVRAVVLVPEALATWELSLRRGGRALEQVTALLQQEVRRQADEEREEDPKLTPVPTE